MMGWRRRRTAGPLALRPPEPDPGIIPWHVLLTPDGEVVAQWQHRIDRWLYVDSDGLMHTITAARAADQAWRYVRRVADA
jgi:hypothetical protein